MRPDQEYPHLAQFLGAYLHQDWPEESGSWEAATDLFVSGESADQVRRALRDLRELLDRMADEAALERALDAFGCDYDPTADGVTRRAWLERVGSRLAADAGGESEPRAI